MENANVRYLVGDVFTRMAELPDASVDLILTSPPFLALRSYLPADHPDKGKEIGSEATPAEFVDTLLRLTAEWRRLLAPHGSLCVELGDTYSGTNARSAVEGESVDSGRVNSGRTQDADVLQHRSTSGHGWPLAKSLTLVPEAYRFALAYGTNPHTGQPSPAGQWRIRNVIRWVRPNPPVGALGDKFRPATSELVVACVSKDRYFDLDAVREPHSPTSRHGGPGVSSVDGGSRMGLRFDTKILHPAGAPPLDWWKISPKGYAGAHYAVWPSELCVKPIKAMCPSEVCRECGEPRRRIVSQTPKWKLDLRVELAAHIKERRETLNIDRTAINARFGYVAGADWWESTTPSTMRVPNSTDWVVLKEWLQLSDRFDVLIYGDRQWTESTLSYVDDTGLDVAAKSWVSGIQLGKGAHSNKRHTATRIAPDIWSDCGHNNYRPGLVLDPFAGTGTTLAVAHGHGRDAIGIDIDERSAELARERVGPLFIEVVGSADGLRV